MHKKQFRNWANDYQELAKFDSSKLESFKRTAFVLCVIVGAFGISFMLDVVRAFVNGDIIIWKSIAIVILAWLDARYANKMSSIRFELDARNNNTIDELRELAKISNKIKK